MQIEFGWSLDGASWADSGSGGAAGQVRMGPRGLVGLLQTRLGLTHPAVDQAVRVAQYLRLIERHLDALPDRTTFWPARSFALDPWSTTRQLLRWRDAAVEAGWQVGPGTDHSGLPPRLAALADVEALAVVGMLGTTDELGRPATLSPGAADDLVEIVELLAALADARQDWPLGIDRLVLHEGTGVLPGLWPRLLALLGAAGVPVEPAVSATAGRPEVTVVQCRDEWTAADVAARFLSAPETGGAVHLLATTDTAVLDRALHRRGLPAVGAVDRSSDRASHQVLGLFLDVAIAPVDVHQLAALLDLRVLPALEAGGDPVGLVPAPVRRALLRALAREPGVGGPTWRDALDQLEQREDAARLRESAREIDRLVTDPIRADALRPDQLSARLGWLADRLRAVGHRDGDLLASLTQVQTLRQVLGMLEPSAPLTRRTLQQIIDACGPAGTSALSRREAAEWTVTTNPAQIPADGGTVLWWGPGTDEVASPVVWDDDEAAVLTSAGARLLRPEDLAALHVDAGLVGLRGARTVIAVLPGRRIEEPGPPSSLLARLETDAGRGERDRLTPESLVDDGRWTLAGRRVEVRMPAEEHPAPDTSAARTVPADLTHLLPQRLSYSQIDTLIACPHRWVLEYALGIRPASVATLPTGPRMIGTLVHAVVETLVHERGPSLTPPPADHVGDVFDQLIPQLASELDLPGRAAERAEVRGRTIRSLGELFGRTADAGLRITGTETRFDLPLDLPLAAGAHAVTFVGSRDVDARDAAGDPLILDLKWTSSLRRYADLHDSGDAIQLASYAWSLAQEEPASRPAHVGYFLLRNGEFVAADPALDPHRRSPLDVQDAWQRMIATASGALDEITAGTVTLGCRTLLEGAGLGAGATYAQRGSAIGRAREAARAGGRVFVEDHCGIGDYAQLCGLIGDGR